MALPSLNLELARGHLARTPVGRLILDRVDLSLSDPAPPEPGALATALVRLSAIAGGEPAVVELDIDPLVTLDGSVVAAAGSFVAVPVDPAADSIERLAIRSYPAELKEFVVLGDGENVCLRRIRPGDVQALSHLFRLLDPQDRRLRLFAPTRELAARLTQIDCERELALVVEPPDRPGELYPGARVAMGPDGCGAEFAIAVRSDQKRRGLDAISLGRVIEHTRRLGLRPEPDDPAIVRAELSLRAR